MSNVITYGSDDDKQVTVKEQIEKAAVTLLGACRDSLLINLRYLDMSLSMLKFKPMQPEDGFNTVTTEGQHLFYVPEYIVRLYKENDCNGQANTRLYLHTVLHCVFKHMYVSMSINTELWDLACDIAIEGTVNELGLPFSDNGRVNREKVEFAAISDAAAGKTAEKIYAYLIKRFMNGELSMRRINELKALFTYDSHIAWYKFAAYGSGDGDGDGDGESDSSGNEGGEKGDGGVDMFEGGDMFTDFFRNSRSSRSKLAEEWGDIAKRMEEEMENFISRKQGNQSGNMMQNLKEMNREKYDYSAFLKKFAVRTEVMKINDDEFDYVYYSYGLELYDNMPLVEPLEYKDDKRIRQFVIAIDTSGSCSGDTLQRFFQKTYNIMKSTETFHSKIELFIIQCDAEVKEVVEIHSIEEFENYIKNVKAKGLGGTDFRPVFEKVQELQKKGKLLSLKGLIYFTDGCGPFPEKKPPYDTAFVFVEDEWNNYNIPSWAIKLILKKEEI